MAHKFGGPWTELKLSVIEKYLELYLTALKRWSFRLNYIDAFAGSGTRSLESAEPTLVELDSFLAGSAARALALDPGFHRYTFIEKAPQRCQDLAELVQRDFPQLLSRVEIRRGDANAELIEICQVRDWYNERAALFLDPYATEVEWSTIAAIAATRSIDAWILFPIAAINRNLRSDGNISDSFAQKLTRIFGTDRWKDALYERRPSHRNLFDEEVGESFARREIDAIGEFFVSRLSQVFAGVLTAPMVLTNSTNSPLFLLCFASGNKKGAAIALRLAEAAKKSRPR